VLLPQPPAALPANAPSTSARPTLPVRKRDESGRLLKLRVEEEVVRGM
jgi:hypothetical protein